MSRCSTWLGVVRLDNKLQRFSLRFEKRRTDAGAEAALYAKVVDPMASGVSSKTRLDHVANGALYQLPLEMLGARADQRSLTSHVGNGNGFFGRGACSMGGSTTASTF
jgi:hypothetical protein